VVDTGVSKEGFFEVTGNGKEREAKGRRKYAGEDRKLRMTYHV
jgi:hypothetical protein